jgi:hypothetical protein
MSDNLTFAELEAQHVELLPPRTVLSLFSLSTPGKPGTPSNGHGSGPGYKSPPPSWCIAPICVVNATAGAGIGGKAG